MVFTLTFGALLGGLLTAWSLLPVLGWSAILAAPFGGSSVALVIAVVVAWRTSPRRSDGRKSGFSIV